MATGLFDSLLTDAPFVVAEAVFADPKHRGFRLPPMARADLAGRRGMFLRQRIRIHDARLRAQPPTLGREGFELLDSPIRLDFSDRELVGRCFPEQCADLVGAATGCREVRTVQYEFRTGATGAESYAHTVHADVCPYVEDVLQVPDGRHFAIFNVWRGTEPGQAIEDMPLALCDARTVEAKDIVYADAWRRTQPRTRLVDCRLIHNTAQVWYCFPNLRPDEALIFRQYDTREEDAALRTTFHTAFADPGTPADAPRRRSVEARVLAVFPERDEGRVGRKVRFRACVPKRRRDGSVSDWRHEEMPDWLGPPGKIPEAGAAGTSRQAAAFPAMGGRIGKNQ
ncbi:MAG: CmcJ/NvfI family oxidoreductase [Gammaproteobacteria bacterium]|nr:CmcJ/NvfI family oxidoreductase [Gammaproteobacteria bacterium]